MKKFATKCGNKAGHVSVDSIKKVQIYIDLELVGI